MIVAGIAALLTFAGPVASDFFPLEPGTKWTYEHEADKHKLTIQQEVLPSVEIGGVKTFPLKSSMGGRAMDTVYYTVSPTEVAIFAYNPKAPLDPARPVIRLQDGKTTKWTYDGLDDGTALKMSCEATLKGMRKVLDKDVEVLELKMDAVLGDEKEGMKFKQTAYYGKGIGLFEMMEDRIVSRNVSKRHLTLKKYQPPTITN